MKRAISHKGFSIVEVLTLCFIFNTSDFYNENTYIIEDSNLDSEEKALKKIKESEKIPLGIFYEVQKEVYSKRALVSKKEEIVEKILEELI